MNIIRRQEMTIYLSLLSVVFLWGTSFAVSKIGLHVLSPLNLAGLRFLTASVIFGLILSFQKVNQKIERQDILQLIVMGFMSITSYFYIQYTGLLYTTSINASLLLATSPLWTTVLGVIMRQEQIKLKAISGMLLAFFGVTLVISKGNPVTLFTSKTLYGDLLLLSNAGVWAIYTLYGKRIMLKYSPFTAVAYIHIFGTFMLLPIILIPNPLNPVTLLEQGSALTLPTMLAVLYLAVLCSVYAYYMWFQGIAQIGAIRTASFYYISPLFALMAGIWLLNETMTPLMLLGGCMVITGVFLTNKFKHSIEQHRNIHLDN